MQTVIEDFYLLNIHEEKGTVVKSAEGVLRYGLAGALLAELALQNRLQVESKHHMVILDETPTGDPLLDAALQAILQADGPQKVGAWVKSLSKGSSELRERLSERLVKAGVATQDDTRLLWVTPYPAGDQSAAATARYWLKHNLRAGVLASYETSLRKLTVLLLAQSCDLLNLVFTKDERKLAQRRIYEQMMSEGIRSPVVQTLQEIGEAVESLVSAD